MAENQRHQNVELESDQFCCSVCLDLLREPVTLPCGHSYCRSCINSYWDREKGSHSCPQCRETFDPRPALRRNNMLAEVVEKLKRPGPQQASGSASALPCAGPADVACDFCCETEPNEASMTCLTCLASYCPAHLTAHYSVPALKTHQLVSAVKPVQDKMCMKHNKLMEIYCQTDQRLVCSLCSVDEHKSHKMVSASTQKVNIKNHLALRQMELQNEAELREKKLAELQETEDHVKGCAQTALRDCDRIFAELVSSVQRGRREVKDMIAAQAKAAEKEAVRMRLQLEEDISKLRARDAELEQLSLMDDSISLIQTFQSLAAPCDSQDLSRFAGPPRCFTDVTGCVSELRDQVQTALDHAWPRISAAVSYVDLSRPPAPKTREALLRCCRPLSLDEATNYRYLHPIDGGRRVRPTASPYAAAPERFASFPQVLCREALSGRCYWEVEWRCRTLSAAVAYADVGRAGDASRFGSDERSWSLECAAGGYSFRHNNVETAVPGPVSNKLGVFLDYEAGVLCFYHVSEPMVLLHKAQATFTRPLHPGLGLNYEWYDVGVFAQLVKLW